jgi:hypothetical protein
MVLAVPGQPPLLLHVGYPKTASTWLQRYLFSWPGTGMRGLGKEGRRHPVRELVRIQPFEFDAADFRSRFEPLLGAIGADGLLPVLSFERLSGHPFSGGHDAKELAQRLKDVFPEAKVLIVIREQRSMVVSTYKWYVIKGGPCTLRRFVKSPSSGSRRVPWFNLEQFEYHRLIQHYRMLFGDDAVHVMPFERFVRDPQAFVSELAEFAGVTIDDELLEALPYRAKANEAPSAARIAVQRRANHFIGRTELNPAPLLNSRLAKRLARRTIDYLPLERVVPSSFETRSEESLRRLAASLVGERYRESNRITQELTGIDLGAYGWTV